MKKVIALILAALLSISLFACGNNDSSKDTGDKTDAKLSFKYYDECAELPTFDSVTEARMSSKKNEQHKRAGNYHRICLHRFKRRSFESVFGLYYTTRL